MKNFAGIVFFFLYFLVSVTAPMAQEEEVRPAGYAEVGGGIDSYAGTHAFFIDADGCLMGWCLGLRAGVPPKTAEVAGVYVQTVNIYGGFHLINMVEGHDRAALRIMGGVASFPLPDTEEWNYDEVKTGEAWSDAVLRLNAFEVGGKFGRRWFPGEVAPHVFLWEGEGKLYLSNNFSFGARIGSPELPRITLKNQNFVHPGHQIDFSINIGQPYWGFWGAELFGGFQPSDEGGGHFGFRLHLRYPFKPEWKDSKREGPKKPKIRPSYPPPSGPAPR